jgi:anti-sigma factor RsiW
MNCDEAQEWITALVDNELSAAERLAIDAHLNTCLRCQGIYAQECRLKQEVQIASAAISAPSALRKAIQRSASRPRRWRRVQTTLRDFLRTPLLRPALGLVVLLLLLSPLMFYRAGGKNIALETLSTHAQIAAGKRTLVRVENPDELKRQLVQAVNGRFAPMGFDLSALKLYPVSGFVEKIAGREVLVTVYQGEGSNITCFTFLGTESDAPADAEKFYDATKKINFYTFSKGDLNAVMHREGDVICIMVAKMSARELLALMRDKARHA